MKSLPFHNKFFLAPMEEVNDIAFRLLCKKAGCGLTYTGMIHPQTKQEIISHATSSGGIERSRLAGTGRENQKKPLRLFLDDKPSLQLFCTTTKGIKGFMEKHDEKVSLWDFNLGCPAKTARKKGFGVFLHHDLESIEEILKTMRASTKKPLTAKLRKSKYTFKILKIVEKYCDAVCIHPRTQQQGYGGIPDLGFAEKFKSKTKLPVIYSGNVNETNAKELLRKFNYIMVGRKAIGNPNIFAKLQNKKSNLTFNDYLKLAEKYKLPFRQIKFQAMNFTKGLENAKELRLKIFECKKIKEIEKIFL